MSSLILRFIFSLLLLLLFHCDYYCCWFWCCRWHQYSWKSEIENVCVCVCVCELVDKSENDWKWQRQDVRKNAGRRKLCITHMRLLYAPRYTIFVLFLFCCRCTWTSNDFPLNLSTSLCISPLPFVLSFSREHCFLFFFIFIFSRELSTHHDRAVDSDIHVSAVPLSIFIPLLQTLLLIL